VEGVLRDIDCSGPVTRFIVNTANGPVTLAIPDPGHVQMRNAPTEFTCGPQQPAKVVVDYAESASGARLVGLVRRMEFR
jgi:hypothetical protein